MAEEEKKQDIADTAPSKREPKIKPVIKKFMPVIIGLAFVVILISGVLSSLNMDAAARKMIENILSQEMGVNVRLAGFQVRPQDQQIILIGLRIANPEGFGTPDILTAGAITIAAKALSPQYLVFNAVKVQKVALNLEVNEQGSNLAALRNGIGKNKPAAQDPSSGAYTKVSIHDLTVDDITLNPVVLLPGQSADPKPVVIDSLHLTAIGEVQNGIIVQQALQQVLTPLIEAAMSKAASSSFLPGLTEKLPAGLLNIPSISTPAPASAAASP